MLTDFTKLASDNLQLNCTLAEAHKFTQICSAIGLSNPRVFVQPKPDFQSGSFLFPEIAKKGDDSRWPDRRDVDTSGHDMQSLGDPGPAPMFLSVSVDGDQDFHTIAPTFAGLTDTNRISQRQNVLVAFLDEVGISSGQDMSGLKDAIPSKIEQVSAILAS